MMCVFFTFLDLYKVKMLWFTSAFLMNLDVFDWFIMSTIIYITEIGIYMHFSTYNLKLYDTNMRIKQKWNACKLNTCTKQHNKPNKVSNDINILFLIILRCENYILKMVIVKKLKLIFERVDFFKLFNLNS